MTDIERVERRLSAVERAVVDGDLELAALDDVSTLAENLEALAERIDAHEKRIANLEGRLDALDGFVGTVESVNETVERRANGAVAAVDRLEYRIDELERVVDTGNPDAVGGPRATREGGASEGEGETENETGSQNRDETVDTREKSTAPPDHPADRIDRATAPVVADDTADGSLPVERIATEIVSAPGADGDSSNRGDGLAHDGRAEPTRASDGSARSRREATQDSLETRLAEPSATDRSIEGTPPDEDDEPGSGVIQSIRSKLP